LTERLVFLFTTVGVKLLTEAVVFRLDFYISIWATVGDCGKKAETPGFDGRTREKVGRSKILSDNSAKKKEYLKFQGNDLILKKMSLKF
jgi:hypothetical protein